MTQIFIIKIENKLNGSIYSKQCFDFQIPHEIVKIASESILSNLKITIEYSRKETALYNARKSPMPTAADLGF